MKRLAVALLCLLPFGAFAFDTYRVGTHVIHINDPEAILIDNMGPPDHSEPITNGYGVHMADAYYYEVDAHKTVKFIVSGGLIIKIDEIRH